MVSFVRKIEVTILPGEIAGNWLAEKGFCQRS